MEETNQGRVACDQLEIIAFLHVLTFQKIFREKFEIKLCKESKSNKTFLL